MCLFLTFIKFRFPSVINENYVTRKALQDELPVSLSLKHHIYINIYIYIYFVF